MAEGMFRHLAQQAGESDNLHIDSAATGNWHTGDPPDERAQAASKNRGFDISHQRARPIGPDDFESFDLILAMDDMNHGDLKGMVPEQHNHKVRYFLSYAPSLSVHEVPDPFFGGDEGFEHVLDLVETAGLKLLETLK